MISLLIPTRGRPDDLAALVANVRATTAPGEVEVIVRVDDDDPAAYTRATELGVARVLVGPRGRGFADLPQFFNQMAAVATGDWLMCGNDDMRFETPGWPAQIVAAAADVSDGRVNVGMRLPEADGVTFAFSCVPRAVVTALGYLNNPRLLWSDTFLFDVFAHCDRTRIAPVTVRHFRPVRRPDPTRIEAAEIERATLTPAYWARHAQCVTEAIVRLGLTRTLTLAVRYA